MLKENGMDHARCRVASDPFTALDDSEVFETLRTIFEKSSKEPGRDSECVFSLFLFAGLIAGKDPKVCCSGFFIPLISLSLSHTFFLSLSLFLSFSLSFFLSFFLSFSLSLFLSFSLSFFLFPPFLLSLSLTHTHTLSLSLSFSLFLFLSFSFSALFSRCLSVFLKKIIFYSGALVRALQEAMSGFPGFLADVAVDGNNILEGKRESDTLPVILSFAINNGLIVAFLSGQSRNKGAAWITPNQLDRMARYGDVIFFDGKSRTNNVCLGR